MTDHRETIAATLLINRMAGDAHFGEELVTALSRGDLNRTSELLAQLGVDRSLFSFTSTEESSGAGPPVQRPATVIVKIQCPNPPCTVTVTVQG